MGNVTSHLKAWTLLALTVLAPYSAVVMGQANISREFPSKPISLVVPLTAGAATDTEFRLFLPRLQESIKQPLVFDFRPGVATTLGTAYVARSSPDGHTLLLSNGSITLAPNFYPQLPYNVEKSFEPIIQLTERYTILMVSTVALPQVHTLQDLVSYGKENPGILNCGTAGSGGNSHIVCASLSSAIGVAITPVHYKGVSQGQPDLLAGRNHLSAGTVTVALPFIKDGKLRPIAALNRVRSMIFPDLKTAIEVGIDVEYPTWLGVFAPAGTDQVIVDLLNRELRAAASLADVVNKLESQGTYVVASTPDVFRKKVSSELARWRKIILEKNIKAEE